MTEKILEKKEIRIEYTVKEIIHDERTKQPTPKAERDSFGVENMPTFGTCTVDKFISIVRNNQYHQFFKVGDKRNITLKNGETITIAICGFDHDVDKNGKTLPVTLTFVDCLAEGFAMNDTCTNNGGWEKCKMRTSTMEEIFALLPEEWQAIIVASKKDGKTLDKLFLPSEFEVWGRNYYAKETDAKQYEFFKNKYNRIKFRTDNESYSCCWWLRSPYSGGSNYFCMVDYNGSYDYSNAHYAYGVAPCFAIA